MKRRTVEPPSSPQSHRAKSQKVQIIVDKFETAGPSTANVNMSQKHPRNLRSNNTNPPVAPVDQPKDKKPKPIFIDAHVSKVKLAIAAVHPTKSPEISFRVVHNVAKTRIYPVTMNDKKAFVDALTTANLEFHTFTDEKQPTFVLRNFYKAEPAELLAIFKEQKVPAAAVSLLASTAKSESPLFIVKFSDATINVAKLNASHRTLDGVSVRWEPLKQSKKRFTQCYKCQRWGHSSSNCGFAPRCVACGDNHEPNKCPRKQLMEEARKESKPKCCNCGGDHTANYHQCEKFKEYAAAVKKTRSRNNEPHLNRAQQFDRNDHDAMFPKFQQKKPSFNQSQQFVNPPKANSSGAKPKLPRQSFRDAFVNPGESQTYSQKSQCSQCNSMHQMMSQMQDQINYLTHQLSQLMSMQVNNPSWIQQR